MLCERIQAQKVKYCTISLICGIKKVELKKKKQLRVDVGLPEAGWQGEMEGCWSEATNL